MRKADLVVGEHYAWADQRWKYDISGDAHKVKLLDRDVKPQNGRSHVKVRLLVSAGWHRPGVYVIANEQITDTWAGHEAWRQEVEGARLNAERRAEDLRQRCEKLGLDGVYVTEGTSVLDHGQIQVSAPGEVFAALLRAYEKAQAPAVSGPGSSAASVLAARLG